MTMVASTSLLSRAIIVSIVVVAVIAILEAIPHRELEWDDTILPLARKYAGVTDGSDQQPLRGKIVVITGCTSGIGLSLTRAVSKLGATVVGIGRNRDRLQKLKDEIPTLEMVQADFNNLTSVSTAANEIVERWDHIDILVNNAGMHDSFNNIWGHLTSVQGYDRVFTVNYLSHFLLTEKLSATLHNAATQRPTLLQISSSFHWAVDGSDLMVASDTNDMPVAARPGGSTGFYILRSTRSYSNSKLAQIYHARALTRKHPLWSSSTSRLVSICPAWVATTIGGQEGSFAHKFQQGGFPTDGWGIASSLVGMLDTDAGNDHHDYYYNSRVFLLANLLLSNLPSWVYTVGLRDATMWVMALLAQRTQKLTAHVSTTTSSPESYNQVIGDSLYDWSYQAIKDYL
jgi:NAD(P)-dependent dehydrogenase (short-subunit alcohol dehydrogenase family)